MAIYLGGNNSRPYVGGSKIAEAYLGGVKVLGGGLPALAPNSLRLQFDDASYDPTVSVWSKGTILDYGWVATRRTSNIWDIRHDGESLHDTTTPFSTVGTNPPTQPWRVLEVNKNPAWNDYWALFARQPYLKYVPLFEIAGTENFGTMFYGSSGLTNSVEWAKNIAAHFQGYTTHETFTGCANAASIPADFGGTKGRTVTVNPGWVTVTKSSPYSYTVSVAPGDVLTCRAQNNSLARNTRCKASWVSDSFVDKNGLPNAYVTAKNARSDPSTTFRWGYANGSRRSVKVNGTTTNTLAGASFESRVAVYLESFNFL